MKPKEIEVSYTTSNSYSTLNTLTSETKNIWFSFHGMGYLSRYFLKYFDSLDSIENYIIAPQAPSKYYQGKNFNYVGASWLTKENTASETDNILNYIDGIYKNENSSKHQKNRIVLGFSQGVSVALRWVASRKISCKSILIHSGGIPKELTARDFSFLSKSTTVYLIYGIHDEYLTEERIATEREHALRLFGNRLVILSFEGKHEVNTALLQEIALKH